MTVRVASTEGPVSALRAIVATGTGDALGSPDGLLRGIQQTIQYLTDRAVFAVERVGVHVSRSLDGVLVRKNCRANFGKLPMGAMGAA